MSSSRGSVPTPLSFDKMPSYSTSPTVSSPDGSYPSPPPFHSRSASNGSTDSAYHYTSGMKKASSPKNVYTHCGRHTDQYLFGGKGFTDLWKAVTKKE